MPQIVKDEAGEMLYVDHRCPLRQALPWDRKNNFAECDGAGVINRALRTAQGQPGRWQVVAWGRVCGEWCSPVGLLRVSLRKDRVEFSYFEAGNQDLAIMREDRVYYPDTVAARLNNAERLLAGRNLLVFPRRACESDFTQVAERMAARIFTRW